MNPLRNTEERRRPLPKPGHLTMLGKRRREVMPLRLSSLEAAQMLELPLQLVLVVCRHPASEHLVQHHSLLLVTVPILAKSFNKGGMALLNPVPRPLRTALRSQVLRLSQQ